MKPKHVIINILPLFVWVTYYYITMSQKDIFLVDLDTWITLLIFVVFTIYNLFSKQIKEFLMRNLILTTSLACGIFISGQMYLETGSHMSDEHYAVAAITIDHILCGIVITVTAYLIKFTVNKTRNRNVGG